MADVCSGGEEGASSLKIVDDFIATREEQLLDSQIVTFNLKELPITEEAAWYTREIMDLTGAAGYDDSDEENRQQMSEGGGEKNKNK